jgi:alpha-L-rhamnosidase
MNLCAPERRGQIAARLAEEVEKNSGRLNTGFLSTPFLLPVLAGAGCAELAFRVLEQTECPGWLHPITLGSTTIPESWDALDRHEGSYNHYSYGAVCDFLFSQIAGIQPVFDTPGYRHFELRPLPGGTLTQAEAVYESLYGTIRSGWAVNGEKMVFHFTIPANTTAAVFLPDGRREELGSGNYEFSTFVLTRLGS